MTIIQPYDPQPNQHLVHFLIYLTQEKRNQLSSMQTIEIQQIQNIEIVHKQNPHPIKLLKNEKNKQMFITKKRVIEISKVDKNFFRKCLQNSTLKNYLCSLNMQKSPIRSPIKSFYKNINNATKTQNNNNNNTTHNNSLSTYIIIIIIVKIRKIKNQIISTLNYKATNFKGLLRTQRFCFHQRASDTIT
eukprot:TRINITY_DN16756_c0_g1_i10.p4 TRINITY_DN16756_c0_g1~~TRINITY_DN16756_c0_g1_i10.p4  ORF type:complete len:189 (+),score=-15.51 TRINITY_DN16756_c0_g1_i10:2525-3091(+)